MVVTTQMIFPRYNGGDILRVNLPGAAAYTLLQSDPGIDSKGPANLPKATYFCMFCSARSGASLADLWLLVS